MDQREQFAKQFIERGKASGASREEISMKLQSALMDYDRDNTPNATPKSQPNALEQIGSALIKPAKDFGNLVGGAGYELYRAGKQAMGDQNAYVNMETGETVQNPFLNTDELTTLSDPTKAPLEGAKRTAGAMSYFVPGGTGAKAVMASGAGAGALYSFSQVDEDAALDEYIKDIGVGMVGGAAGAGIAYAGSKLASKMGSKFMEKLSQKFERIVNGKADIPPEIADKAAKRIIDSATRADAPNVAGIRETLYGSGLPFSKKGFAFEKLKPQETFKTMLEDGIWGTPSHIAKKTNMVTGENGVLSNIVREGLDSAGQNIDLPPNILDVNDVTGIYTTLDNNDVNSLLTRAAKAAPGGSVTGKDANALFDFQRQLEKEAWDVLSHNGAEGKLQEFAKLKLVLAGRIESAIDQAIDNSGVTSQLSQDPAIVAFLQQNVSENLARKVAQSGGNIRALRGLQKAYVRMGKIAELSSQENSSLGKTLFKWIDQILVFGPSLSSISRQGEAAAGTGASILIKNIQNVGSDVARGAGQAGSKSMQGLGSVGSQLSPVAGAAAGLGNTPPSL